MLSFLVRRVAQGVVTLFIVTVITFFLINAAPGGPSAMMRMDLTASERHALALRLGLEQPLPLRYLSWLLDTIHGNLGTSLSTNLPVAQTIAQRFPNTLELAVLTLLASVTLGLVLGVASAQRRGGVVDYFVGVVSVLGLSIPTFWLAIVLILVFSVDLRWLPASGLSTSGDGFQLVDRIRHLIMPVLVLSLFTLPNIVRFTRSAMLEAISQDYVRTARAKGLSSIRVVYRHALRNALIPVLSILGVLVPRLLGGAIITETIFGWPGMGQLMVQSATDRDYPMVMGLTVVVAAIVIGTNFLVDLAYSLVDPRIRHA